MSIENIPMSSLISDLNDVNIINEDENQTKEEYQTDEDINLDEIINNQIILDNNFINYVIENGNIETNDDTPSVHIIMKYYLNNMYKQVLPDDCNNKYLVTLIRLIHMCGILFMMLGCMLPKKLLTYHIIFCLKALILWDLLDDRCYMSVIIQKIAGYEKYNEFIPANILTCKMCVLMVMFISIFGIAFPQLSLFSALTTIFDYLKMYK